MADRITVQDGDTPVYTQEYPLKPVSHETGGLRPSKYDIVFRRCFDEFREELEKLGYGGKKICIVSDSTVASHYMKELQSVVSPCAAAVTSFVFPAGEENKNLDVVRRLYEHLILQHFDRNDLLIALGGGVTGDLTGFAAATYLRGIAFIQVPTTLLSQVDSSIGGKTGVDFDSYKNMVGAFYMPRLVYISLAALHTLTERQYLEGMGEIIKHSLIKDRQYFYWLKDHMELIRERDLAVCEKMIRRSCEIKRDVVERDPKEHGERGLLNYGHTLGHAIEKETGFSLLHGECVALGCVASAYISLRRGDIARDTFLEIEELFHLAGLPVRISGLDMERVLAATKHDKKMDAGVIKFILLKQAGEAYIDRTVTMDEMREALGYICEDGIMA